MKGADYVNIESMSTLSTHQDHYINLAPPPIPPRTYQGGDSCRNQTREIGSQNTRQASTASRPYHSRLYSARLQQSKTLYPFTTACPEPSPMLAQDIQVNQHQIKSRADKK